MYVEHEVISSAAQLIQGVLDNGLPVDEEIEWKGLGEEDGQTLKAVLDELSWGDLVVALERAAARLPELPEPDHDPERDDNPPAPGLIHVYFMHDTLTPENVRDTRDLASVTVGKVYELPGAGLNGALARWRVVRVEMNGASVIAHCTDAEA